jgi:SAM-dependent methyltransferase
MTPDYADLKERTRRAWSLGDYTPLAELLAPAAAALVDGCAVSAGQEVLDVAAGTGNAAIAAAREGAAVVASDLTPALIEKGRARAAEEGVEVEWVEADVEELPFEDGRFDCSLSVFGAMFAPRPERAAAELFRVVRPGGTVGMANWTPDSFPARNFAAMAAYVPAPEGIPPASEWGSEPVVEARLAGLAGSLELGRRTLRWEFSSPEAAAALFAENAGPHVALAQALGERYADFQSDWLALLDELNTASDGSVALDCEYLLVVARKRG